MNVWNEFWDSYKALDQVFKLRNSEYLNSQQSAEIEKFFQQCLVLLRDNCIDLVEQYVDD